MSVHSVLRLSYLDHVAIMVWLCWVCSNYPVDGSYGLANGEDALDFTLGPDEAIEDTSALQVIRKAPSVRLVSWTQALVRWPGTLFPMQNEFDRSRFCYSCLHSRDIQLC